MDTVWSMLRLFLGGCALFGGVVLIRDADQVLRVIGVAVGGAGVATTLQEYAFVHARFMRGRKEDL